MASEPIVDLDSLDLNAVRVSPDEVGRINPQSGDMRHLDHVIWMDDAYSMAVGVKQVRDDEFWVPGHIPGRPLLPGVIMIEAVAQLGNVLYHFRSKNERFMGFTRCDDCTFRGQVVPGDTLYLLTREVVFSKRRSITYGQGMVNGKLVFEVQITGMLI